MSAKLQSAEEIRTLYAALGKQLKRLDCDVCFGKGWVYRPRGHTRHSSNDHLKDWQHCNTCSSDCTAEDRATAAEIARAMRLLRAFRETDEDWNEWPDCATCGHNLNVLARLRAALEEEP